MAFYVTRRIASVDIQTALGVPVHLGGALTFSGAYATTLTVTGTTALTLPTSGTVTALGNAVTGTGSIVRAISPALTTPNIDTPSAGTLTNCSGLPIGGVTGWGAGIAAALAVSVGTNGSPVLRGGALGTPSSGVLSSCSGLPIAGISGISPNVATALALVPSGTAGAAFVLVTSPTISGATLSGTTTISNAPVLTALSGFVYANAGSAATASTTIPTGALNIAHNETPTGALDGANTTFTLAHTPLSSSLLLCLNGQILRPGGSNDYTVSGATVTTLFAPASGDYVSAHYFY